MVVVCGQGFEVDKDTFILVIVSTHPAVYLKRLRPVDILAAEADRPHFMSVAALGNIQLTAVFGPKRVSRRSTQMSTAAGQCPRWRYVER